MKFNVVVVVVVVAVVVVVVVVVCDQCSVEAALPGFHGESVCDG